LIGKRGTKANPGGRELPTPPHDPKVIKISWEKRLDLARLAEKTGITLSDREMLVAARDFEQEVGIGALGTISPERLELVFAAYLRKWAKRFQRKDPPVEKYERKH
jgi:hypothetical protein